MEVLAYSSVLFIKMTHHSYSFTRQDKQQWKKEKESKKKIKQEGSG